jgi:hypothetical protein
MSEQQMVVISKVPNPDILVFALRIETRNHLRLGRNLINLPGIECPVASDIPLCMDHKGQYFFGLEKAKSFTWEELLPRIKKIFEEYFPGGVEFIEE